MIEPQRHLVVRKCLGYLAELEEGVSEVDVRIGVMGIEPHRLFEMRDRLWCPAQLQESQCQIVVGVG